MLDFLSSPLMIRALIVAILVGLAAPVVGTYLVQRRLTLLGDGIGHIALTGVALGWLAANAAQATNRDAWAIPGAIIASIAGALLIEWMRRRGNSSADVALALVFYGGIAGGVILIGIAGGTTSNLTSYLSIHLNSYQRRCLANPCSMRHYFGNRFRSAPSTLRVVSGRRTCPRLWSSYCFPLWTHCSNCGFDSVSSNASSRGVTRLGANDYSGCDRSHGYSFV